MITREILEAQLTLYRQGQERSVAAHARATEALETAKVDLAAIAGAIDCCETLLRILAQFDEAKKAEGSLKDNKQKTQEV